LATGRRNASPVAAGVSSLRTCPSLSSKSSWQVTLGSGNLGPLSDQVRPKPACKSGIWPLRVGLAIRTCGLPALGVRLRANSTARTGPIPGNRRNAGSPQDGVGLGPPREGVSSRDGWVDGSARVGPVIEHPRSVPASARMRREKHSAGGDAAMRANGVEKRVGRRHALLGQLPQAITPGAALLIWDVNRRGWPALHGLDLDRLALHRPVL